MLLHCAKSLFIGNCLAVAMSLTGYVLIGCITCLYVGGLRLRTYFLSCFYGFVLSCLWFYLVLLMILSCPAYDFVLSCLWLCLVLLMIFSCTFYAIVLSCLRFCLVLFMVLSCPIYDLVLSCLRLCLVLFIVPYHFTLSCLRFIMSCLFYFIQVN